MQVKPLKTRIFRENENLPDFVLRHARPLENSILVVTSKIVALSEGRTEEYKNEKQKIALIKQESQFAFPGKLVWATIKDGMLIANAGIDESNAKGKLILLPKDSFRSAYLLRKKIKEKLRLKKFGVVIVDSRFAPFRTGALGIALGYAGFRGVRNYIGKKDIFGRVLQVSKTNVADSLATAAVLCMGEGKERQPLVLIHQAPVEFAEKINKKEILISPEKDIYAPLFNKIN